VIETIELETSIQRVKTYLQTVQDRWAAMLQSQESQTFLQDIWSYPQGGGGDTRVLMDGEVIEKAGVNMSHIYGLQLPPAATLKRPELAGASFQALGLSTVVHPFNPFVPTSHANIRFFIATLPNRQVVWWFGGGFDLTPYYGFVEDCSAWHLAAKQCCDTVDSRLYAKLKAWCDNYFFLKHRNEARGIGGIFFDDFNEHGFEACFNFFKNVFDTYMQAYYEILLKRKNIVFTTQHKNFQAYRRGRYVEFNLLYDRGTLFGIQSGGRTESILMSLPPNVTWRYDWHPEPGSPESSLYSDFLPFRDWV